MRIIGKDRSIQHHIIMHGFSVCVCIFSTDGIRNFAYPSASLDFISTLHLANQ